MQVMFDEMEAEAVKAAKEMVAEERAMWLAIAVEKERELDVALEKIAKMESDDSAMKAHHEMMMKEKSDDAAELARERAERKAITDSLASLETRLLAAFNAPEDDDEAEAPEIDLTPLKDQMTTLQNSVNSLMLMEAADDNEDAKFVIDRYPIPPGSMLPYGPVKAVRIVKGKS